MDRAAIALSAYKARRWARTVIRQSFKLFLACLLLGLCAYATYEKGSAAQAGYFATQNETQRLEQQISHVEEQIARLQNGMASASSTRLSKKDIERFITELQRLPLNGGLEYAELMFSSTPQLKLSGNFAEPQGFAELENYLKQQQTQYRIAHLHSNEVQQIEFVMIIDFN